MVRIEEMERTEDGYVEVLLKLDNDEVMDVEILVGDLLRLDDGAG